MPKEKGKMTLWAQYFDAGLSQREGRRVPRELAVNSPKVAEIQRTARELGYDAIIDPDVAYPRQWWLKTGRVIIDSANRPKREVIIEVARKMKEKA